MMRHRPNRPRRKLLLRQLETRLRSTAVPFLSPDMLDIGGGGDGGPFEAWDIIDDAHQFNPVVADNPTVDDAEGLDSTLLSREGVIVDSKARDYESLLTPLGEDRSRELVLLVLDDQSNSINQIDTFLASQSDLDAVHLICHGNDAELRLGDTTISGDNLNVDTGSIAGWAVSIDYTEDRNTAIAGLPTDAAATHDVDATNDGTANLSIGASDRTDLDFGYRGSGIDGATISNFVWYDHDTGSVQDGGEPSIEDATFNLLFAGADGTFGNLDDSLDTSDLPTDMAQTFEVDASPNNNALVALTGAGNSEVNFGSRGFGTIGDLVHLDGEADGLQTGQDRGLTSVDVTLTYLGTDGVANGDASGFQLPGTSGAFGAYTFANLPGGNFVVTVNTADAALPSDVVILANRIGNAIGASEAITLADGGINSNLDFAFAGTRTIGDRIWYDDNGDDDDISKVVIDATNEPGLGGVTVQLTFAGQDGIDGNADDFVVSTTITVDTADAQLPDYVFYRGNNVMPGQVWLDQNGNDINGETNGPGLGSVTVEQTWAGANGDFSTTDDNFVFTTVSDASGNFNFYDSAFTTQLDTADGLGMDNLESYLFEFLPTGTFRVTVNSLDRSDIDFGFSSTGEIGDVVWIESDGDGLQDATNEPGLVGGTVDLQYAGVDGIFENPSAPEADDTLQTRVTDSTGRYRFDSLASDGLFRVWIDPTDANLPAGIMPTAGAGSIPLITADPLADRIEFSSLVYDDDAIGPDLILPKNKDLDGRARLQFAFDANHSFLQKVGLERGVDWYGYRDQPLRTTQLLPVDPIYSGLAEPGTALLLKIFDEEGREIGSRTVMADSGGSWIASFPGTVIWENSHAMTVEPIGALHTLGEESQYNTRRYFQPALHPSMFFVPRPTIQSVMQQAPSQVLAAIHQANLRPLQFGTASHSYDLNFASNSTAGN